MKSKFPLSEKLGLKITTRLEMDYTGTEKTLVSSVSAEELEAILQKAPKLHYTRAGNHYASFKTERQPGSTFSGILLCETELKHCDKHIAKYIFNQVTQEIDSAFCKDCGIEMEVTAKPKDNE